MDRRPCWLLRCCTKPLYQRWRIPFHPCPLRGSGTFMPESSQDCSFREISHKPHSSVFRLHQSRDPQTFPRHSPPDQPYLPLHPLRRRIAVRSLTIRLPSMDRAHRYRRAWITEPPRCPEADIFFGVVLFSMISRPPTRIRREAPSVRNTIRIGTCSDNPKMLAA